MLKNSLTNLNLKKYHSVFFLQAFKKWNNEEITEYDRKFYYEGYISTFDKTI